MNGYVKVNILGVVLLVLCFVVMGLVKSVPVSVFVFVMWLIVVAGLNYMEYLSSKDELQKLRSASRNGMFDTQVEHLVQNYLAIKEWGTHVVSYDEDSSVRKSYDLIARKSDRLVSSAITALKTYDYRTRPRPTYLMQLLKQSDDLVEKLHELRDLLLQVDDSASNVDISYVDDMLESLREMRD